MIFYTIIGLIILAAVLLVIVVLAQNPKGGGVSSQFGGSGASQLIGVKKTGDLLEKLTWGFAIAILALSLTSNILLDTEGGLRDEGINPEIQNAIKSQGNIPKPTRDVAPLRVDTTATK